MSDYVFDPGQIPERVVRDLLVVVLQPLLGVLSHLVQVAEDLHVQYSGPLSRRNWLG